MKENEEGTPIYMAPEPAEDSMNRRLLNLWEEDEQNQRGVYGATRNQTIKWKSTIIPPNDLRLRRTNENDVANLLERMTLNEHQYEEQEQQSGS